VRSIHGGYDREACSTLGRDEKCTQFWSEILKGRDHSEDLGVYGRIILKWIIECGEGMDWMRLAQDRDQWGAVVNTVMNLRVP